MVNGGDRARLADVADRVRIIEMLWERNSFTNGRGNQLSPLTKAVLGPVFS